MQRGIIVIVLALAGVGVATANTPPLADAGLDQRVDRNATVYLDAGGSTDPDGRIDDYNWTITAPDGTEFEPDCPSCERTEFVPGETGQYNVTVEVTDDDGATQEDTLYVTVEQARPPDLGLSGPADVLAGETQTYEADATARDANLSTVTWRVDGSHHDHVSVDGDTATVTVDLSFAEGEHTVTAVVIDRSGKRTTEELTVRAVSGVGVNDTTGESGSGIVDDGTGQAGESGCPGCDGTGDGLVQVQLLDENGERTAEWSVDQDQAERMRGGATVNVAGAEVHVDDIADIPEENEGEKSVQLFSRKGASERDMVEAAFAGVGETNRPAFEDHEGSLGTVDNERSRLEYSGWSPSGEDENSVEQDQAQPEPGEDIVDEVIENLNSGSDGSSPGDSTSTSGGTTGGSGSSSSSSSPSSRNPSSTFTGGYTTGGSSSSSDSSSGSTSSSSSGGYHGGTSYTGGGGYGF